VGKNFIFPGICPAIFTKEIMKFDLPKFYSAYFPILMLIAQMRYFPAFTKIPHFKF